MSLDERLKSGLRTLAEPAEDNERALNAFREHAYPRRSRRRVFEAVGTTLAVAALAVGVTAVLRVSPKKSAGFVSPTRPAGIADCTNDDVKVSSAFGLGGTEAILFSLTAVHEPCWYDKTVRLTITQKNPSHYTNIADAGVLPVRANPSVIELKGVVPKSTHSGNETNGLSLSWKWSNWCSETLIPSFQIDTYTNESSVGGFGWEYPTPPPCTDASKPSTLDLGADKDVLQGARSLDDRGVPIEVRPYPALTSVRLVSVRAVYKLDDMTLLTDFDEPPCLAFDHVRVVEDNSAVKIFTYLGQQSEEACHEFDFKDVGVQIHLAQSLGHRGLTDGKSGQPVVVVASSP